MAPYPFCLMFSMYSLKDDDDDDDVDGWEKEESRYIFFYHKTFTIMFFLMNKVVNIYACWHRAIYFITPLSLE